MTNPKRSSRPVVELAKSIYQPSRAEMQETIDLGDMDPEEVARALLQPVEVRYVSRPSRGKRTASQGQ